MSNITLHTDSSITATCVPNTFIDHYMIDASGEYVKIYLYLLRCINGNKSELSISKIADKFDHTEKDIKRALKYWEKVNLLHLEYDKEGELHSICLTDSPSAPKEELPPSDTSADTDTAPVTGSKNLTALPKKTESRREYSMDEIANLKSHEDVQMMLHVAEKYLCHPLTPTDIQAILYWYDTLEFSMELIVHLIEYCVENGHSSIRYMDKVALSWADMNIKTVEQAKEASSNHNQAYYAIIKSFGISNRNLVPYEMEFIDKWMKEYGFTLDIITEACKRTIQSTHQPDFRYADGILTKWKNNKIHHLKDIALLDDVHKQNRSKKPSAAPRSAGNKFNNFSQRNYNYDQLEQQLLKRSIQ